MKHIAINRWQKEVDKALDQFLVEKARLVQLPAPVLQPERYEWHLQILTNSLYNQWIEELNGRKLLLRFNLETISVSNNNHPYTSFLKFFSTKFIAPGIIRAKKGTEFIEGSGNVSNAAGLRWNPKVGYSSSLCLDADSASWTNAFRVALSSYSLEALLFTASHYLNQKNGGITNAIRAFHSSPHKDGLPDTAYVYRVWEAEWDNLEFPSLDEPLKAYLIK